MQLGNNRVWDYAADNYVHRLIQNKTDGKLIQLDEGGRVVQQDEKMDSITLEVIFLFEIFCKNKFYIFVFKVYVFVNFSTGITESFF